MFFRELESELANAGDGFTTAADIFIVITRLQFKESQQDGSHTWSHNHCVAVVLQEWMQKMASVEEVR